MCECMCGSGVYVVHILCFEKDLWDFCYNVPAINSPGKDKGHLENHSYLCERNHCPHWAELSLALKHQSPVSLSLMSLEESTVRPCQLSQCIWRQNCCNDPVVFNDSCSKRVDCQIAIFPNMYLRYKWNNI